MERSFHYQKSFHYQRAVHYQRSFHYEKGFYFTTYQRGYHIEKYDGSGSMSQRQQLADGRLGQLEHRTSTRRTAFGGRSPTRSTAPSRCRPRRSPTRPPAGRRPAARPTRRCSTPRTTSPSPTTTPTPPTSGPVRARPTAPRLRPTDWEDVTLAVYNAATTAKRITFENFLNTSLDYWENSTLGELQRGGNHRSPHRGRGSQRDQRLLGERDSGDVQLDLWLAAAHHLRGTERRQRHVRERHRRDLLSVGDLAACAVRGAERRQRLLGERPDGARARRLPTARTGSCSRLRSH